MTWQRLVVMIALAVVVMQATMLGLYLLFDVPLPVGGVIGGVLGIAACIIALWLLNQLELGDNAG